MTYPSDIYRGEFTYRSAEIGPDGTINLFRVADLLQEVAGKHADRLGFGMEDLGNAGTTWALTKLHICMQQQLIGGKEYKIQTWPSGTHRLWAIRRYRLLDSEDVEVGQAISHWMILDKKTHRPQRLPESIMNRVWPEPPAPEPSWTNFGEGIIPDLETPEFSVRLNEIDINNHVNNAHYLAWAMNTAASISHPKWTAFEAELLFEAESKLGDIIQIRSGYLETGNTLKSAHHIHRVEPEARIARVNILWKSGT